MTLVLDCSVSLAWTFHDEHTPEVLAVLRLVTDYGAHAPSLWPLEVANGLEMSVRRSKLSVVGRDGALEDLRRLRITIDEATHTNAWGSTLRLATYHRLTVYDAAYLELALRLSLPLATLDVQLREAARATGVGLLAA